MAGEDTKCVPNFGGEIFLEHSLGRIVMRLIFSGRGVDRNWVELAHDGIFNSGLRF